VGKRADLLIHELNPLEDFKLMYGTGAIRLNDEISKAEWKRSLRYTIRAGVVYDTEQLLAEVRDIVNQSWVGSEDDRPPAR
jgi:imidazolonepropionase